MLNAQIDRARTAWNSLSLNQRVAVIGVLITAVLALGILWLTRPSERYEIAFARLPSEDAAAIVEELRVRGIPYELSSDGTTIRVPADQVASVRLDAASMGLPKGGSNGFELFDQASWGLTDFTQRVNYQRAMEGELQRTIARIDAVEAARVHIVIPEESLFIEQTQPTTASVVLKLKPGRELTDTQIKGITHLVSGAVPNLDPENLTIVDSAGNPIWAGNEGTSSLAGLDEQFRLQQAYEANLERQLQTLVNPIAGVGHAVVRVNATLNWDERSSQNEIFSPDGTQPQIRSQQERTEMSTGTTALPGGVPGVDTNVQTFQEDNVGAGQNQSSLRDVTTNYEISRRIEQTTQAPGQLQRLSVAVVLDGKQVDPAVAQEIQNVVSAAAGLVPQRGDTITVSAVPFSDLMGQDLLADAEGPSLLSRIVPLAKIIGLLLIPLIALLLARRLLVKPAPATPALAPATPMMSYADFDLSEHTEQITVTEQPTPVDDEAERERQLQRQQVLNLAHNDPAQIAQLLRAWMNEEQ